MKSTEKYCGGCLSVKPRTEFNKQHTNRDGLRNKCRTCTKRYAAWYRNRYPLTPEKLAKQRAYNIEYRNKNRERINEARRRARAEEKRIMRIRMTHA